MSDTYDPERPTASEVADTPAPSGGDLAKVPADPWLLPACGRCGEVAHRDLCWFDPRDSDRP